MADLRPGCDLMLMRRRNSIGLDCVRSDIGDFCCYCSRRLHSGTRAIARTERKSDTSALSGRRSLIFRTWAGVSRGIDEKARHNRSEGQMINPYVKALPIPSRARLSGGRGVPKNGLSSGPSSRETKSCIVLHRCASLRTIICHLWRPTACWPPQPIVKDFRFSYPSPCQNLKKFMRSPMAGEFFGT